MKIFSLLIMVAFLASCMSKDDLKKMLIKNPDILTDAIEANPDKFFAAIKKASSKAQEAEAQKREEAEQKQLEKSFDNPLVANLRTDEIFRGNKTGPITLVEYSDFECPYCKRGFNTVMSLLKKYKGKIRFVYKHLPLSFHKQAMISSRYYEAIRVQSHDKAIKFHDEIYQNQRKLQNGESFLKSIAKKIGVDMAKLAKDINSSAIQKRIEEDMAEAAKFGFQGTPGFLLNGIPVKGAYPVDYFTGLIEKLVAKGKISL